MSRQKTLVITQSNTMSEKGAIMIDVIKIFFTVIIIYYNKFKNLERRHNFLDKYVTEIDSRR